MLSRVVPGVSLTMTRSSPRMAFVSIDLPTFGRPTMAMDSAVDGSATRCLRQHVRDHVHEVADAHAVQRADGDRLAQTELVELDGGLTPELALRLVGDEEHRPVDVSQPVGDVAIGGGQAVLAVDNEEHDLRFRCGHLYLGSHKLAVRQRAVHEQPAGIDETESLAAPLDVSVDAVACRPGGLFDDRFASADDAVEKRRLPDVRPPDERNNRSFRCCRRLFFCGLRFGWTAATAH